MVLREMRDDQPFQWEVEEEDKEGGTLASKWVLDNGIHAVYRRRLELEINPAEEGGYIIRLRIERDRIKNVLTYDLAHPEDADWTSDGYDNNFASPLLRSITSELR